MPREQLLDHWIFADGITVDCVWARGEKRVAQGRHLRRDEISAAFRAAMLDLAQSQP